MIKVRNTPQLAGITILGDYEDLNALYDAVSRYSRFFLNHQDNDYAENCLECLLGLCYDLRHAYQGDRGYESVENRADSIGLMAGILYELPQDYKNRIETARASYDNGNLYFSVEVLYPWALYYMFTLKTIADAHFRSHWFEDLEVPYDKYMAEKDEALLRYFVQLIWEALQSEIPDDILSSVYEYTSLYTKTDYYISYPDMYLEWLCTWWILAAPTRETRHSILPLLCLELSSIYEEDELEIEDKLSEDKETLRELLAESSKSDSLIKGGERKKRKKGKKETTEAQSPEVPVDDMESKIHLLRFYIHVHEITLSCVKKYDTYLDKAADEIHIPYFPMEEYMYRIHEHVSENGPFSGITYHDYLANEIGEVDWEKLEW
jgi:hypothetical protein